MADRTIVVKIVGDSKGFTQSIEVAEKKASGMASGIKNVTKGIGLGIGIGAFNVLTDAIGGVTNALGEARDAIRLQQTLLAQTNAGIASTGGAANVSAQHIVDFSNAIEDSTGIEREAIQTGQNMLLTFTGIRNEVGKGNDIFDQATQAITDMATKMNGGAAPAAEQLQQTAIQLGKALNDPIKGITALSKVGVAFTAEQKNQIKTLVSSGDAIATAAKMGIQLTDAQKESIKGAIGHTTALLSLQDAGVSLTDAQKKQFDEMSKGTGILAAQKIILGELQTEFGGAAVAFGETDAGMIAKGNNQMGDAFEKLAVPIEKVAVVLLPILADVITTVVDVLGQVWTAIQPIVSAIAEALIPVVKKLIPVFQTVFGAIGNVVKALAPAFKVVFGIIGAQLEAFFTVLSAIFDAIGKAVDALGKVFKGLGDLVQGVFRLIGGIVKGVINAIINVINAVIRGINSFSIPKIEIAGNVIFGGWGGLNIRQIPHLHSGGIVPGSPGSEVLTVLQAGEHVTPRGGSPGQTVNIHIDSFIGSDTDIDRFADKVAFRLRTAT